MPGSTENASENNLTWQKKKCRIRYLNFNKIPKINDKTNISNQEVGKHISAACFKWKKVKTIILKIIIIKKKGDRGGVGKEIQFLKWNYPLYT